MIVDSNGTQLALFESPLEKADTSMTFADNMKLPIHKWFRYSAGFSGAWVRDLIHEKGASNILDPFAGSGTVMLESEFAGVESYGVESHPFVNRIANAKLFWKSDPESFKESARLLLDKARGLNLPEKEYPELIKKCYPPEVIFKLESLKQAWRRMMEFKHEEKELLWFLITSILRKTSPVGTASWQYVLPNKSKGKVTDPFQAFEEKLYEMATDMRNMQRKYPKATNAEILAEDARSMKSVPDKWCDLVITSPPYANNYDYADATRLEMTFWEEIEGWGDLHEKVRSNLIVSCSQHAVKEKEQIEKYLTSTELQPIHDEIAVVYKELSEIRLTKGGKKNYHLMILAYFYDLSQVFVELRRVTKNGGELCFVIGDSAPYGIYVPVDKWLGELAIAAGFYSFNFEKLRDRNTKWKNRKHRVPLHEGRLWING